MRKVLSAVLSIIMIVSLFPTAMATESAENERVVSSCTEELADGNVYTLVTTSKSVAILTDNTRHLMDVAIVYTSEPGKVYQWTISDFSGAFLPESNEFWASVISCAESRTAEANITMVTHVIYEEPVDILRTRSSAGADLMGDLEELIGPEYFGRTMFTTHINGEKIEILQSMDFRIQKTAQYSWQTALSVAGLIAEIGAANTSGTKKAICEAFGLTVSALSVLPANSAVNIYTCRGMEYRHASINDSEYAYSMADKFIDYVGYEDANLNSPERAYVATDTQSITYIQGQSYYTNYLEQVEDAYEMFEQIGQMD